MRRSYERKRDKDENLEGLVGIIVRLKYIEHIKVFRTAICNSTKAWMHCKSTIVVCEHDILLDSLCLMGSQTPNNKDIFQR